MNYGSANPAEIIGTTLAATFIATSAAILADRWYRRKSPPPPITPVSSKKLNVKVHPASAGGEPVV
jgi:spore maturation protein A